MIVLHGGGVMAQNKTRGWMQSSLYPSPVWNKVNNGTIQATPFILFSIDIGTLVCNYTHIKRWHKVTVQLPSFNSS